MLRAFTIASLPWNDRFASIELSEPVVISPEGSWPEVLVHAWLCDDKPDSSTPLLAHALRRSAAAKGNMILKDANNTDWVVVSGANTACDGNRFVAAMLLP